MATTFELENQPGESLRDALDEAFEQHSADDSGADAPKAKAEAPAPTEAPASAETDEQRARDTAGRFAKAQKAQAESQEGVAKPETQPAGTPGAIPAAPPPEALKAPASWTPAARELWKDVPATLQAEIHRREGEAGRVLQEGASARQFISAFENIVRPYELFIRQENSNPLQAVQNLMSTAAEFRVGTPSRKVELVAGMIRNFGIDLEMLDQHLARSFQAGGAPQQQAQQQFRDPRVDQLLAAQQAQQQQFQQQDAQIVQQTLQTFAADPKHEFYGDVAPMMGDILAMRAQRGEVIDLEKAYAQACQLHEGVSTILAQRQAGAQRNNGTSQAVLRQKRAAASVKSDGAPQGGQHVPKDDSIRASIEAAFEAAADR